MNLRDPESMNAAIGNVLRFGVLLAASVTIFGVVILLARTGTDSVGTIAYLSQVPHDGVDVGAQALLNGIGSLSAYSWVQLGVLLLVATPVARVVVSTLLFAAERDRLYVVITTVVLILLLFSMLVTPFIPGFHA